MVTVQKLTPETLLSHPRRSPAVPNAFGTLALYTASTHSFATGKTAKTGHVLAITSTGTSSSSTLLWDDDKIHDANWIPGSDTLVLYLRTEDKGETSVQLVDVAKRGTEGGGPYEVGRIEGPVSTMKLRKLEDGEIAMVVAGQVAPDGKLYNKEKDERRHTGRVFDTVKVRAWDQLYPEYRASLWYTTLALDSSTQQYTFSHPVFNLLQHHPAIEAPFGLADGLMDALGNFDLASHGIAFAATIRGKDIPPRPGFPSTTFYQPVKSFKEEISKDAAPQKVTGISEDGVMSNVRFTPDGTKIAFSNIAPGSIVEQRLWIADVEGIEALKVKNIYEDIVGIQQEEIDSGKVDIPATFEFAGRNDTLLIASEHRGRVILSRLDLAKGERPKALTKNGSVSAVHPLTSSWSEVLVSSSCFTDSSIYDIVDVKGDQEPRLLSSSTKDGKKFGLDWSEMVEEIEYEGADGWKVQSWIVKPMGFNKSKKYPWIFLPHGGPESAWADSWSTRWNMAVFAEMGYFVILPNITGSTGFGLEFCNRIHNEWGGRAFTDLLNLLDHLDTLSYLDQSKAVLAGASYSGYLVNWFMGHDVISRFCAAICHSPVFNIPLMNLQSDNFDFPSTWNGSPYLWLNFENLEQHNPSTPGRLARWKNAPPTLMIHAEKDYRCPITEGLAGFRVLQAQGVPSRFVTFPDECHWILGPENAKFWWGNVSEWMQRCVNGEIKRGDRDW